MAGSINKGYTMQANEPKATIGQRLSSMVDDGSLKNLSDEETKDSSGSKASSMISVPYVQATDPTFQEINVVWDDTHAQTFRGFFGNTAATQDMFHPLGGEGYAARNQTGGTRTRGEIAGVAGTESALEYAGDANDGRIWGVIGSDTADGDASAIFLNKKMPVLVSGPASRGDFLSRNSSASFSALPVTASTANINDSFGICLTAIGATTTTLLALVRPHNHG